MLDDILKNYKNSTYDFRNHACPQDPLVDLFEEWVEYYRMKWAIGKTIRPNTILEIGVRYGYSARAFLDSNPQAHLIGIDADTPTFGGQSGAVDWAEQSLVAHFNVTIIKENSQSLTRFPGDVYDLVHIDGQQDGDGTFHDLDLALIQARHILVDGYFWTRDNFLAANEWLWLNKAAIENVLIIPGYAGELLIRPKIAVTHALNDNTSLWLAPEYTKDYYLNDCGGFPEWRRSKGKIIDSRLQAVADVGMALSPHRKVLDLGAGRGELTRFFAKQGAQVTAIDYSTDAVRLIRKTLESDSSANVDIVCNSVLNTASYDERYDLAIASDIVEHLLPEEDDLLYKIVSQKLKPSGGILVIHTAPNLWHYLYEHPRQQEAAKQAGFWLPRIRRTWYERIMHMNEQNPRVLKNQLSQHFPYVLLWFADDQSMGGSLLRHFTIAELRSATSIFAIASHRPINRERLEKAFCMAPLTLQEAESITLKIDRSPDHVCKGEIFILSAYLNNSTDKRLASLMPNPLHISYHWLDEEGSTIVYDGLRSVLAPPLYGHGRASYPVTIKAPDTVGQYVLRVLLVQEMVRWHESRSIFAESSITVHD